MHWPSPQDYNEAIQNPSTCFSDAELKLTRVALGPLGLPHPITGAFSSVYRVDSDEKSWAVRCFLRPVSDQQKRYSQISEANLQPDCLIGFRFLPNGIRLGAKQDSYPIVVMDWVDGETLDCYIARNLKSPAMLFRLLDRFLCMMEELERCGVAHGDLQHGNVLVHQDNLKLVDYDNFFVPAMEGTRSSELGHRNYQHPQRAEHFGPQLDRFSGWVIASSIACVACDPRLWNELGAGDECLLFRGTDYEFPEKSLVFSLLSHHPLELIRSLALSIRQFAERAIEDVPPLSSVQIRELIASSGISTSPIISTPDIARQVLTAASQSLPTSQKAVQRSLGQAKNWGQITVNSFISWVVGIPVNAYKEIKAGDKVFAVGDYFNAKVHYLRALAISETDLLELLKHEPKSPWAKVPNQLRPLKLLWQKPFLLLLGICYARSLKWDQAALCFKGCINMYAQSGNRRAQAIAALCLGAVLYASGEQNKEEAFDAARSWGVSLMWFREACTSELIKPLESEVTAFLIALGDDCAPLTDRETKETCYKLAYFLDQNNAETLIRLAEMEVQEDKLASAYEYFAKAFLISKTVASKQLSGLAMWVLSPHAATKRAMILEDPMFNRRLELDSSNHVVANGNTMLLLSELEGFLPAFDAWSIHLAKAGRYDEAALLVSIALRVIPFTTAPTLGEISLRFTLGFANWLAGRLPLAQALFKESVNRLSSNLPYRVPYHALASLCLAAIYSELGKSEDATKLVKEWTTKNSPVAFDFKRWLEEGGAELVARVAQLKISEHLLLVLSRHPTESLPSSIAMRLIGAMQGYS